MVGNWIFTLRQRLVYHFLTTARPVSMETAASMNVIHLPRVSTGLERTAEDNGTVGLYLPGSPFSFVPGRFHLIVWIIRIKGIVVIHDGRQVTRKLDVPALGRHKGQQQSARHPSLFRLLHRGARRVGRQVQLGAGWEVQEVLQAVVHTSDGGERGLEGEVLLFINPQASVLLQVQVIQQHLPTTRHTVHDVRVQSGTHPSKDLKGREEKKSWTPKIIYKQRWKNYIPLIEVWWLDGQTKNTPEW